MAIPVKVEHPRIHSETKESYLVLRQVDAEHQLRILIGFTEAAAIATRLEGKESPRPLTHDLYYATVQALEARVERVVVNRFEDNVYYATITFSQGDKRVELDARPSDAVALAVCAGAPVFVAEEVFAEALPRPVDC